MEQIYLIKDNGMSGKMDFNFTYTFLLRLLTVPLTLLIVSGCSLVERPSISPPSESLLLNKSLYGVWSLSKDDEYLEEDFSNEKISFHKDGQLLVDGLSRFCGKYYITGNQIHMIFPINGLEIVYARQFKIDEEGLHLNNPITGFAHYKKIKENIEYCAVYESWKLVAKGFFTLKAPEAWTAKNKIYKGVGIQEFQLINKNASKILIMIRMPLIYIKNPDNFLKESLNKVADKILANRSINRSHLRLARSNELYGISGLSYKGELIQPIKASFKGVGKEMDKALILLIFYYISDELHELEHIAKSIYVEGRPISSQHPIY